MSVVSVAHSARPDLEDAEVLALVRRAVDGVGGIRAFVQPRALVVVKPNQTLWFPSSTGVTTDPRVVAAVVTLCREAGAGHIVVGDSSGGDLKSARTLEATGVKRLALAAGADEVVGFEDLEQEEVALEVGGERILAPVPKVMLEARCVVNVPKAKTHFEDPISCALKNWVGILGQDWRPRVMDDALLYDATAQAHLRVPAALTVVDGIVAGEGAGPGANEPVRLGCVVAGTDPVAVDVTVARLLGIDPSSLGFAKAAAAAGVGTADPSEIEVRGARVEDVAIRAKRAEAGFAHLPIRVLVGEGVTWAGSLGHMKSIAEVFHKFKLWPLVEAAYGPPTFMIGRVEDPEFERRVEEGPYFVIDDAALDRYRTDPRVVFVPGHPATHNIFPYLFRRLSVPNLGPAAMDLARVFAEVDAWFRYRTWEPEPARRAPPQ